MHFHEIIENKVALVPGVLTNYCQTAAQIENRVIEAMNMDYLDLLDRYNIPYGIPLSMIILKFIISDMSVGYYMEYLDTAATDESLILILNSDTNMVRDEIEQLVIRSYRSGKIYSTEDITNIISFMEYKRRYIYMSLVNKDDGALRRILGTDANYCPDVWNLTHSFPNKVLYDWIFSSAYTLHDIIEMMDNIQYPMINTNTTKILTLILEHVDSNMIAQAIIRSHNDKKHELFIILAHISHNLDYKYILSLNPTRTMRDVIDGILHNV